MVTRRQFLKAGVVGGVTLAAVGSWYWHRHHGAGRSGDGYGLDAKGHTVVAALAPVLLRGALPEPPRQDAAIEAVVAGVDQAIMGLSAAARKEVMQLFALLAFAPTRTLVAGVSEPWSSATRGEIEAFLERWRFSRFQLLQTGYAALHDLVLGAWYGNPASWAAIDYPGPPEIF